MSLLVDMSAAALDPSYAEVAARKRLGVPVERMSVSRRVAAGVLLVGLGTGVAAAQTRLHANEAGASHRALVADVQKRTRDTDRLADEAAALRRTVGATRTQVLGADARGRAASAQVAALELVTGATAVRGPGLVVTLDDAHGASSSGSGSGRGGQVGDGRVYDRDIQDVVNALWAAGAEAVAVNDQRLTVQTAIRSAGEAILVDLRPLSPPYVLHAIGNVGPLERAFVDSPTARRFQTWTSLYGLGFRVRRAGDLRMPAAGPPDLRLARSGGTP